MGTNTLARELSAWGLVGAVDRYPGDRMDDRRLNSNLKFYSNEISSKPNGDFIEAILETWGKDYKCLPHPLCWCWRLPRLFC